jgi:hypothetical protein
VREASVAPPRREASKASTAGASSATGTASAAAGAAAAWFTNALSTGRKWLFGE